MSYRLALALVENRRLHSWGIGRWPALFADLPQNSAQNCLCYLTRLLQCFAMMALTPENTAFLECPTDTSKPWTLAVRAVIREQTGRWLLLRRSSQCVHFAGTWELPGGKLNSGETIDGALCREVREETGLLVRPTELAGTTEREMSDVHLVVLYFHTAAEIRTVILSEEHYDCTWVQPGEMDRLELHPETRAFLQAHRGS
jgi:8-oxo-dGTP diphosphatase